MNGSNNNPNGRRIFRETRFDLSTHSFLKLFAGMAACMLLPIAAAFTAVAVIQNKYGLQPGSVAASVCGYIIIACIVASCISTLYISRNYAVGNKFKYFILDEKGRLMYTNAGKGPIFAYYSKNVPMSEKLKATPNVLFGITFFHRLRPFYGGFSYMRMEQFFKYNQKHKLAEKLLSGDNYRLFCRQIVSVSSIKFFKNGCSVAFSTLSNGDEIRETCHIYTTMEGYEDVVSYMLRLFNERFSRSLSKPQLRLFSRQTSQINDATADGNFEAVPSAIRLSAGELKQVRKLILRKNIIFVFFAILFLTLGVLSLIQWQSTYEKSQVTGLIVFSRIYERLSANAYRRVLRCLLWIIIACASIFKCIIDLVCANKFVKQDITSWKYIAPQKKLRGLFDNYRYKASVEYTLAGRPFSAILGVSPKLLDNNNNGKAVLVMKSSTPCFLILEEPEN